MTNPVLMHREHAAPTLIPLPVFFRGRPDEAQVLTPVMEALAAQLAHFVSATVLIPAPTSRAYALATQAKSAAPKTLQSRLRILDANGSSYRRLLRYLEPVATIIRDEFAKHPKEELEDHELDAYQFYKRLRWKRERVLREPPPIPHWAASPEIGSTTWFWRAWQQYKAARSFLYRLLEATSHKASIAEHRHDFIMLSSCPMANFFPSGDAGRVAREIDFVISRYRSLEATSYGLRQSWADPGVREAIGRFIESSEFELATRERGKLGYLADPAVGLRRVRKMMVDAIQSPPYSQVLDIVGTAASFAPPPISDAEIAAELLELIGRAVAAREAFSPPVISIGGREFEERLIAYSGRGMARFDGYYADIDGEVIAPFARPPQPPP